MMVFKNDRQRRAVMSKLNTKVIDRAGSPRDKERLDLAWTLFDKSYGDLTDTQRQEVERQLDPLSVY